MMVREPVTVGVPAQKPASVPAGKKPVKKAVSKHAADGK